LNLGLRKESLKTANRNVSQVSVIITKGENRESSLKPLSRDKEREVPWVWTEKSEIDAEGGS